MQRKHRRTFLIIFALILATFAVMGLTGQAGTWAGLNNGTSANPAGNGEGLLVSGRLVQDKVLQGSDGRVSLALTLTAPEKAPGLNSPAASVDLIVVLDRSGSMNGRKINDARQAVLRLMETLSTQDRLSLVTYSNAVEQVADLRPMTAANRKRIAGAIGRISANGGTNLGGGLRRGIEIASASSPNGNMQRIILISDGLANQGITDPYALGNMAAIGIEKGFAVSTVGVGQEFNEELMTILADNGGGSYYYLENPSAFAAVFRKEYQLARAAAAESISVSVPLPPGVELVDAGGYRVERIGARAVFNPGSLHHGQSRKFYLTFQVPTNVPRTFRLDDIRVQYRQGDRQLSAALADRFTVACVNDAKDVMGSIRKDDWRDKVVQEDFSRLKEEVAADIREGKADQAMQRIRSYRQEKAAINQVVGSRRVTENLETEVDALRTVVQDTFSGPAPAVAAKQKKNAKTLQYEGYRERRDKK
ncbi:MAG: VWA domain-containing protein [Desulfosarcina sp.]|nr:VWA domain-containing protein [Desulfobacterales bacterium]